MALLDQEQFFTPEQEYGGSFRGSSGSVNLGRLVPYRPMGLTSGPTVARSSFSIDGTSTGDRTSRTTFEPSGDLPTLKLPEFEAPEFDERKVESEAQRIQGPNLRRLRQQLRESIRTGARSENPNVTRMTIRDALQGFGAGLGNIQTAARREARSTVEQRYQDELRAREIQHSTERAQAQANFNAALENYFKTGTQVTTSKSSSTNMAETLGLPSVEEQAATLRRQLRGL